MNCIIIILRFLRPIGGLLLRFVKCIGITNLITILLSLVEIIIKKLKKNKNKEN